MTDDQIRELLTENRALRALTAKAWKKYDDLGDAWNHAVSKARAGLTFHCGNCEWCGASWPHPEGATRETILAEAVEHMVLCPKHVLRIERDALRDGLAEMFELIENYDYRALVGNEFADEMDERFAALRALCS